MSRYLRTCSFCSENDLDHKVLYGRYATYLDENNYICEVCGNTVRDTKMPSKDYNVLVDISQDIDFIESMIKLVESDPIEYQLKMSQFRNQIGSSGVKQQIPCCPHCNSTNISSIGTGERISSIAVLGIFSKKINKSFKCKNCGYTW